MKSVESVTMKEGRPVRSTRSPFTAPIASAKISATAIAGQMFHCRSETSRAMIMPAGAADSGARREVELATEHQQTDGGRGEAALSRLLRGTRGGTHRPPAVIPG